MSGIHFFIAGMGILYGIFLQEIHVRIQHLVLVCLSSIAGYGYDGNPDLFFHFPVNGLTD
jgi:hypothetical protein